MAQNGPVILVDDDVEDQELVRSILAELGCENEIKSFSCAQTALEYLINTDQAPFIIVSDINMPKMTGIEFKRRINDSHDLRQKSIPFVFLTTSTRFTHESHELNIQGYFHKGNSVADLNETIRTILTYWKKTRHLS